MTHSATYSPEDNKIRITPDGRLDTDTYTRVRAAGFIWAPKQGIFVAPMWTPARYDLAAELCGEVGDEDTTLAERATQRADRFEGYSEKRTEDATAAADTAQAIAGNIPLGQPILVGHHSERKARKDKERIDAAMTKAVRMWETAEYWQQRAAGALHHARYKQEPRTRARRIKTLGAEQRKHERNLAAYLDTQARDRLTVESGRCSPQETTNAAGRLEHVDASIEWQRRWIAHYTFRIAYETAMLNEQGAGALIAPKARPKQPPIVNTPEPVNMAGMYRNPNQLQTPQQLTKAEYAAKHADCRGCRKTADGKRVRVALFVPEGQPYYKGAFLPVFLTDSKVVV